MRNLTDGQRRALILAAALVAAGMVIGLLSSFTTLYGAALAHRWTFPAGLPLAVDLGIPAYVILDHLAVTLGERSRLLRGAAWSLAGFTVWANAAVFPSGGMTWRVIHAAMPALWVLGTEGLRLIWRLLRDDPEVRARARALAFARADARAHARDILRAELGRMWRKDAPVLLRRQLRSGRLPAPVTAAIESGLGYGGATVWEPAVQQWVSHSLTHGDRVKASVAQARHAIARTADETVSETPVVQPRRVSQRDTKRDKARRLIAADPGISAGDLGKAAGVPRSTAARWKTDETRPRHVGQERAGAIHAELATSLNGHGRH